MAKNPKQEVQLANARDAKASKDLDRYYAQLKQMNSTQCGFNRRKVYNFDQVFTPEHN